MLLFWDQNSENHLLKVAQVIFLHKNYLYKKMKRPK